MQSTRALCAMRDVITAIAVYMFFFQAMNESMCETTVAVVGSSGVDVLPENDVPELSSLRMEVKNREMASL